MANIKIEGKEYDIDSLPQEVKGHLIILKRCNQTIKRCDMDIAIAQTARVAYFAELNLLLEQVVPVGAEKVEVVEAEEVDEVHEVEILSAEEVDYVEVLEAEEVEANR